MLYLARAMGTGCTGVLLDKEPDTEWSRERMSMTLVRLGEILEGQFI